MKKLNFFASNTINELARPMMASELTEYSPALTIFNDFAEHEPLLIAATATALEAEKLMHSSHVNVMFVVDQADHFSGIVNKEDLSEQEIVKKLSQGFKRNELLVSDFMRSKSELKAFDYAELSLASIEDVIQAFKNSGQQQGLVIDREQQRIRGVLSTSDIAKKLHLPTDIEVRSSFTHVLAHKQH
ncbi:CBS domain-containing protein [Dasania sp. GY-MA-18]|uniref:CBS domain-containing protein n=1 Tax=Dasania phycosphaerae TaxID=2950436 RepID=A0A9J6RME4_9GAMM|nr:MULTISPECIES: CBS domain-containing protein [Dasania]MCR8923461.1 CBS domain-containing protein [Dasania sp. GY-MA-18]MCZ0865894.1 CBS domain-containing protein [Dasania phycosphaerae]MCZ0869618.1 CBS domain-containing protein [Dasania phycosphaerae]